MRHPHPILAATLGLVSLIALSGLSGCGHDARGRLTIIDRDGYYHDGYYDEHQSWHGGYYDHDRRYHEDSRDWHR